MIQDTGDCWVVLGADENGVVVAAEPGMRYDTQGEAEDAAELLGNYIGISE